MAKRRTSGRKESKLEVLASTLNRWRVGREVGERIPEKQWALAVEVAQRYGIGHTAYILKLNRQSLMRRVNAHGERKPKFVELAPRVLSSGNEWTLEMGYKESWIKIESHGLALPDLSVLSKSLREA